MKISKEEAIKILSRYDNEYYTPATREAHRMGIEALREQEERRWIPVTERLPENCMERVLVKIKDANNIIGHPDMDTDRFHPDGWVRWGNLVTHRMPLPDAPKEDA